MGFEIRKEEPPQSDRAGGYTGRLKRAFATLRANRGDWFRTGNYSSNSSACAVAKRFRDTHPGTETVCRKLFEGGVTVYAMFARYVGEPKEAQS